MVDLLALLTSALIGGFIAHAFSLARTERAQTVQHCKEAAIVLGEVELKTHRALVHSEIWLRNLKKVEEKKILEGTIAGNEVALGFLDPDENKQAIQVLKSLNIELRDKLSKFPELPSFPDTNQLVDDLAVYASKLKAIQIISEKAFKPVQNAWPAFNAAYDLLNEVGIKYSRTGLTKEIADVLADKLAECRTAMTEAFHEANEELIHTARIHTTFGIGKRNA